MKNRVLFFIITSLVACAPYTPAPSATLVPPASATPAASAAPAPSPVATEAPSPALPRVASPQELDSIFHYIKSGWTVLKRSNKGLLQAAVDPKFPAKSGKWPVYVPDTEDLKKIGSELQAQMSPEDFAKIELRPLPKPTKLPIAAPAEPGILYLPKPYVVPGGRFNEMYGWDSYFILLGLVRDGEIELAKDMVENFVYEIDHYGMILNANRSYYLTRSQPPFLTEMALAVYHKTGDKKWLASVLPAIRRYYAYWTSAPHLTPATGLSRYHDLGKGPSIEVVSDEKDEQGHTHYDRVRDWYRAHPDVKDYDLARFYDRAADKLTDLFYVADRSMRESGYDPSNRFGPFNIGILDYDPVCLNSLLYRMESEAAEIETILDNAKAAAIWKKKADERAKAMNQYLWDPQKGLYLDYDFTRKVRRDYAFGTTFFPLWAGLATKEQAATLVAKGLPVLGAPGGLATSTNRSGSQWDAPFGWAPLQIVAAEGLRRYGYAAEADRISVGFLSLVLQEFLVHNAIFEKYDVIDRRSAVAAGIKFGYSSNEIGFGWTNAAFTTLHDALPEPKRAEIRKLH